jgi:hypothetical protein
VLEAWIAREVDLVACTTAFGMGIDRPDVRLVVHWNPAQTVEGYHQAGLPNTFMPRGAQQQQYGLSVAMRLGV